MLNWHEHLYISDNISKNPYKIVRRLNQKKATPGIYLLTLPSCEKNIMDILSSHMLLMDTVRRRCPVIIGIAKGKDDACQLMQEILEETYRETGSFQVKDYLENR